MNDTHNRLKSKKLRKRAEEFLDKTSSAIKKMPAEDLKDLKTLVKELQIHQVELEIQNDELRRTEGKLAAEKKRYTDLYDFAPVGYLTFSDQQMILEANLTAAAMLGVERGLLIDTLFRKYISMGDQDTFYLYCRKLAETKDKQPCNLRLLRKNGADFYAQMECDPVFDENGDLDLIRAIVIDITQQHRAAEIHRESEARYRALFDNMKDGVCIYEAKNEGEDFVFIDLNRAAEKIENIHKDALLGKSVLEVFPAVKEFGLHDVFKRVWKTGEAEKHPVSLYRDERIAGWRENFVCKLPSGEIVAVYSDETDRKQGEEVLKRSEERFRTVADFTYNWEYWVAPDGHTLYVSPSCERITGYGSQAFLSDPGLIAKLVHPDDRTAFIDHTHQMGKIKEASTVDFRILTRSGEVRWISHSCQPVYSSEGQYLGQRASNRDISKRKRMGEALQQSQKMEAIAMLTGGIAHDYNNLMSIIMGNLSIAMEDAQPGSAQADCLNEANIASRKVRDLTHELMSLSRGGAPVKEVASLTELLRNAVEVIPNDRGISFNTSIPQDLWPVPYDPYKMVSVFRNVLVNGVEAMPEGGVITMAAENLSIVDEEQYPGLPLIPGDYVHVSIQDQGVGIPEAHLSQIFDPYFSTKAMGVQKGMGLGLATAYAIVQKHGGHMAIDSSPGAGTTVNIYLPAEGQRVQIDLKNSSPDESPLPMKRVLVMDDEEMLRKLARQMLERMGYSVETVKDGVEAIEAYQKQKDSDTPFDAVILDLTIKGGMGGEPTIRELLKIDPDVKAIVSSGYFNDPVMSDFEKYGFMGAMPKPYDKKTLKEVLENLFIHQSKRAKSLKN